MTCSFCKYRRICVHANTIFLTANVITSRLSQKWFAIGRGVLDITTCSLTFTIVPRTACDIAGSFNSSWTIWRFFVAFLVIKIAFSITRIFSSLFIASFNFGSGGRQLILAFVAFCSSINLASTFGRLYLARKRSGSIFNASGFHSLTFRIEADTTIGLFHTVTFALRFSSGVTSDLWAAWGSSIPTTSSKVEKAIDFYCQVGTRAIIYGLGLIQTSQSNNNKDDLLSFHFYFIKFIIDFSNISEESQ